MDTTMPVADPGVRARRRYAIAATTLFAACAAVAYVDGPRPGLVVASALLSAAATVPYLVATLRGQVKPRLVTWGTWCMLTAMAALASASDGDHPATAYALVGTIATGAVVAVGWRHGDRDFGRIDIACLLLVVVGVVAWQLLEMPAAAVLIACLIEAVGLVPAVVHAWRAPREGTPATYALLGAGGLAAVAAAWGDWTVTAVAYPACIAASMALVVAIAARPALRPSIGEHPGNSLGLDRAALAHGRPGTAPGDVEPARDDLVGAWAGGDGATDDDQRDDDQRDDDQRDDELSEHDEVTDDEPFVDTVAGGTRRVLARTGSPRTASRPLPSRPATPAPPPGHGVIEARRLTVLGWVRRYGPAYGAGIVAAPSAAHLVAPAGHLVTTATAFTAEFVAFYGVLVWGDLRAARRWGGPAPRVVLRRLVTECGPAELLDLVLRPVLMYLAIAATAAAVGSLIGALSCDLVYWTLVTIGYHVARATPGRHRAGRAQPSHQPASPARPTVVTGPPASRPESRPRVVAVATRPRTTARARPTRQPADPAPAAAVGPTPYLLLDPARVRCAYQRLRRSLACLDGLHYAVKANPDPAVLAALHEQGCGFEVASPAELAALAAVGVDPRDVLYSHPVKPVAHIAAAHEMGCWRLAADSVGELDKIARHAPHAAVYIRLRPPRAGGAVGSEGKFGVGADTAVALLRRAADLGLDPHGLTFHVGSQATEATSWADAIRATAPVLDQLREQGIRLAMLDIGGGFPVEYPGTAVDLDLVDAHIRAAVAELPYRPRRVVAEPGRALVADAGTLVSTVIGTATRAGTHFAHLDTGAFHGLIEALESHNTLRFPMRDSRAAPLRRRYTVTGPSCDSQDTIGHNVALSADLGPGDIVHIGMAGAYTTSYTTAFNGFDVPRVVVADPMADSVLATADPATADAATAGTAAGPAGRDGAVEVAVPA